MRLLGRKHLVAQVCDQVPVELAIVGHRARGPIAQREAREVQGGGPAFGFRAQELKVVGAEGQLQRVIEQRSRLGVAEAQVVAEDLAELSARA
jgi:hypothetical protein